MLLGTGTAAADEVTTLTRRVRHDAALAALLQDALRLRRRDDRAREERVHPAHGERAQR
jgi:hypothetical protein